MNKRVPPMFYMHPKAHHMKPGAVAFIPGWIVLFFTIITLSVFFPYLFPQHDENTRVLVNRYLFAFMIGSLMPAFDDLFSFLFGPPFAHHSLFHSFLGTAITYLLFIIFFNVEIAKYAFTGNLYHIFFNYYLDYVTPFFPFTYREYGLTDILGITTYWIKVIHYPIIFFLFAYAVYIYL